MGRNPLSVASAVLLVAGVLIVPSAGAAAEPPDERSARTGTYGHGHDRLKASFTWKMKKRTRSVVDRRFFPEVESPHRMILGPEGEPGLWDGVSSVPLKDIRPRHGYQVSLDACRSEGNIKVYQWWIDGRAATRTRHCTTKVSLRSGPHRVRLRVWGHGRADDTRQWIRVRDVLVVAMGDSYSSGEGNPTVFEEGHPDSSPAEIAADNGRGWDEGAFWDYAPCHRSTRSGQAQAAVDLENSDPHTSVTFIYVACSGGEIDTGILGEQHGETPQVGQAYDLTIARGRSIDAITLGIGGNDVGFVPLIVECLIQVDCFFSTEDPNPPATAELPVIGDNPVGVGDLATLALKPNALIPDQPGFTPSRVLRPSTLQACLEVYREALVGSGGITGTGCRASIGDSPVGLVQVADCLSGLGAQDCVNPAGNATPGLRVAAQNVVYTDYPDLTKFFPRQDPSATPEYCDVSIEKSTIIGLLEYAQENAESLQERLAIQVLIDAVEALAAANIGLTGNEFEWADDALLRGAGVSPFVQDGLGLTGLWDVITGAGEVTTIGAGERVDFANLIHNQPALGETTRRSADLFGWTPALTYDLSVGKGLCAPPVSQAPPSVASIAFLVEVANGRTNASGAAHPNPFGQEIYRSVVGEQLLDLL